MNVNQGRQGGGPHGLTRARPGGCVVKLINHSPKKVSCEYFPQRSPTNPPLAKQILGVYYLQHVHDR